MSGEESDDEALEARLRREFVVIETEERVGDATFPLLRPRSPEDLISEADFEHDERLPYWADVWPSARVLARVVLGMAGSGNRLLELGCGSGLVASAAARAGFAVLATDYYEDALRFTRVNVHRSAGSAGARRLVVRHVDWRQFPDDLGHFDVVVASDVLYERPHASLVATALARTLAGGGTALVADPGRVAASEFELECQRRGLRVPPPEEVPYHDGDIRQTIRVYAITWRRGMGPEDA